MTDDVREMIESLRGIAADNWALSDIGEAAALLERLSRELDEAREDRERLDWMEAQHTIKDELPNYLVAVGTWYGFNVAPCFTHIGAPTLRAAIDAARAAERNNKE